MGHAKKPAAGWPGGASAPDGGGLRFVASLFEKGVIGAVRVVVVGHPDYTATLGHSAMSSPKSRWRVIEQVDVREPDWLSRLYSAVIEQSVDVVVLALTSHGEE